MIKYGDAYLEKINALLSRILHEESEVLRMAAERLADHIARDGIVHVYSPGGHANIATQEIFFRAGGLAPINPVMDSGTMLTNGARASIATERKPGHGREVIAAQGIAEGDILVLVSAYGVNCSLIDAALEARARGAFVIGLNSHEHARSCPADHPARHPSGRNLQDIVDLAIDTKVPVGDALVEVDGFDQPVGAASTFTNIFALNTLVIETVAIITDRGEKAPVWRSVNAPGGEEANQGLFAALQDRIHLL